MLLILVVTSYVTTFLSFFIYCLPHHLLYLDMCDVITYVTLTVGSLRPPPMQRWLDEVLSILNALATQVPSAKLLGAKLDAFN